MISIALVKLINPKVTPLGEHLASSLIGSSDEQLNGKCRMRRMQVFDEVNNRRFDNACIM
jgi:hypothetical protein